MTLLVGGDCCGPVLPQALIEVVAMRRLPSMLAVLRR